MLFNRLFLLIPIITKSKTLFHFPICIKPVLKKYFLISGSLLLISINAYSQIVYEPLHRDIYQFLSRLSQKGLIELYDVIKPYSRTYIAAKLKILSQNESELTAIESRELAFYKQDFYFELTEFNESPTKRNELNYGGKDAVNRYRLFSYRDQRFSINLSPIYGVEMGTNDGEKETHRWNGISIYGYLSDNFGFSFNFRDNREEGANIDIDKSFTPATGVDAQFFEESNAIEYSEIHTSLSYDWSWGSLTAAKDFMQLGREVNGQVILSTKTPSFPFIRLDAHPVDWLYFNYFHAWLESDVVDSSAIFPTLIPLRNSFQFRDKYLASHSVTVSPKKGLDITIGESMVYSDRLEIAYLMPLMFFRLADHYLSDRNNEAGSNAQLFGAISSRNHIKNTHLYLSLFIDDLSVPRIFNEQKQINHVGATMGASLTDAAIDNLTVTGEYTRINPFVYKHFIPTELYTSSSYYLGHWMGPNADLIYGKLNYRIKRGLQISVWGQKIRKGGEGAVRDQYTFPHKPFLFGLNTNYTYLGGEVKYELTHEFFFKAHFQYIKSSREQEDRSFINSSQNSFKVALFYGL